MVDEPQSRIWAPEDLPAKDPVNEWRELLKERPTNVAPAAPIQPPVVGTENRPPEGLAPGEQFSLSAENVPNEWRQLLEEQKRRVLLQANPELSGHLGNLLKFTGHGIVRGLADDFGMPVDAINTIDEWLHPAPLAGAMAKPGKTPELTTDPIYYGSTKSIREGLGKVGIPTSSSKEEGVHDPMAYLGDKIGEFTGANLPFVAAAPAKIPGVVAGTTRWVTNARKIAESGAPVKNSLWDLATAGTGPGLGAFAGGEIAGKKDEPLGELIGGIIGGFRPVALEAAVKSSSKAGSWFQDWLGFGGGAEKKVGKVLSEAMQDPKESLANIKRKVRQRPSRGTGARPSRTWDLFPGAEIPSDIKSGDDGLIALRRSMMSKDAVLDGDYRRAQEATRASLVKGMQFSDVPPEEVLTHVGRQKLQYEDALNNLLRLAEREAEQARNIAFQGVELNSTNANNAQQAYAATLRTQLDAARNDMDLVVKAKWDKVDKSILVDPSPVYTEINSLRSEHRSRRAQSDSRFPSEFIDQFFEKKKVQGADGKTREVERHKFGPETTLQEIVDLDSEVGEEIRKVTATGNKSVDRVYVSYLTRLSKALQNAKEHLPSHPDFFPEKNLPLQEALMATRVYHDTFTRGPVGSLLGHDVPGTPDVLPGDTLRHFLSRGPGGVDKFDAFMKAATARTGASAPIPPAAQIAELTEKYIRQDFHDAVAPNGVFSQPNATQWMRNNSGPMGHFPALRKEFENAIVKGELLGMEQAVNKKSLDDLRHNAATLFMEGKPGELFNGALHGPDQYEATRRLLRFTSNDPSGRANEGLGQMALDNMLAKSIKVDKSTMDMERIDGSTFSGWVRENAGMIRALDEVLPGISKRFDTAVQHGKFLEGFNISPTIPQPDSSKLMLLRDVMARMMGANVFTRFGHGAGGSIQTAAIGSQAFKQLAAQLTPDEARKVFRNAMLDPAMFEALTKNFVGQEPAIAYRFLHPFFLSMGIPLAQPILTQPVGAGHGP